MHHRLVRFWHRRSPPDHAGRELRQQHGVHSRRGLRGGPPRSGAHRGGLLDLTVEKPGFLPAQRRVDVPWQDYVAVDPIALVILDSKVTAVDLSQPPAIVNGNASVDQDGTRTPRLLFSPGTQATMRM